MLYKEASRRPLFEEMVATPLRLGTIILKVCFTIRILFLDA
jgi:hypothetical protein